MERAAKMVRTQLLQPLAHKFGMSTELLQITDGKITSYDGVLSTTVTEAMDGKELWATAQCLRTPPNRWTTRGRATPSSAWPSARSARSWTSTSSWAPSGSWSWPSRRTWAGCSTRRSSPRGIEAGVTQGLGAALTENLRTPRGLIRHPDLTGYALPTALDAPDIRIVKLVEERDVVAPFGAKAVSAVPVVTSLTAIASAVRAATGRPVNRLPIRPQAAVVTGT